MTDELKPCPFCGGKAEWGYHDRANGEHHRCGECGVEVPGDADNWNRRADCAPLAPADNGLVERLRNGPVTVGKATGEILELRQAADTIITQAAEIERLKAEVTLSQAQTLRAMERATALGALLDKAVEGLEPFAGVADLVDIETEGFSDTDTFDLMFNDMLFDRFTLAHFRAALLTLTAIQEARHGQ